MGSLENQEDADFITAAANARGAIKRLVEENKRLRKEVAQQNEANRIKKQRLRDELIKILEEV
jgi:hypothetical protein